MLFHPFRRKSLGFYILFLRNKLFNGETKDIMDIRKHYKPFADTVLGFGA